MTTDTTAPDLALQALRRTGVFRDLPDATIEDLARRAEIVMVEADVPLFAIGDRSDDLYVVVSGRLDVVQPDGAGGEIHLRRLSHGDTVGEIALIDGEPRSATVRAVRDAVLLRISRLAFEQTAQRDPAALLSVCRVLVRRARVPREEKAAPLIGLVPVSPRAPTARTAEALAAAMSPAERVICIDAAMVAERLGPGAAAGERPHDLTQWLDLVERDHDQIILIADSGDTPWTRHCIRAADTIVMIASATDSAREITLPGRLRESAHGSYDRRELLIVHPDAVKLPRGTRAFLDAAQVDAHHHVRLGVQADLARAARLLAGRGHGLALAGGAARGFAHIGVIRALRERRIPIDIVAGTSMGSIVAAQCAAGWSPDRMRDECRRYLVDSSPFDFTVPIVAATRGHRFQRMLQAFFGDTMMEDLWVRCATVSSSAVSASVVPHERGPVTYAVRASCALPGLLPPVVTGDDVLVDGVFLENLPVHVVKRMGAGRVIAVNVIPSSGKALAATAEDSALRHLGRLLNPFSGNHLPPVLHLAMQGFFLGAHHASAKAKDEVELYIEPDTSDIWFLDFGALDAAIVTGYEAARRAMDSRPRGHGLGTEIA